MLFRLLTKKSLKFIWDGKQQDSAKSVSFVDYSLKYKRQLHVNNSIENKFCFLLASDYVVKVIVNAQCATIKLWMNAECLLSTKEAGVALGYRL